MIRRSLSIALTALAVSIAAHLMGLGLSVRTEPEQRDSGQDTDVVALGNRFEELAETPFEPVIPEAAPTPEPEPEPVVEPERVEPPTSDVNVASSTPKQTFAPDTSVAQEVRPDLTEPVVPEGLEEDTAPGEEAAETGSPAEVDANPAPQQGEPNGSVTPVQALPATPVTTPPVTTPPVTPEPERLAALPAPSVIPAVPSDAETPEADAEPAQDPQISASLRPRPRTERPDTAPEGTADGSETGSTRPALIESPLAAYQRSGTNLFGGQSGGARASREGFSGSGGVGNSDETNYAGQVLVHLNRTRQVAVSGRGWARVFFEINPDGSLAIVDIIDGSGSSEIDRAARAQVRLGEPFPRPPNGQRRKLTFVYSMR